MLVEAGQACIWDFSNNEFSPSDWWGGRIPAGICIKGESTAVSASSNGPFVGSTKSNKKYNYPTCSAAKKIAPANLVTFTSSAEARATGYATHHKRESQTGAMFGRELSIGCY